MSLNRLRIATRQSPLALWQAEHVAAALRRIHPHLQVEILGMRTRGDKILDAPLAKVGGKGLFVKELEQGLLAHQADIAVHSMKDVPVEFPAGLHLPVILAREDPLDAFVSNAFETLDDLPSGARVGTSSLRRQCQLAARRPDLEILPLRGNVNTRLAKLDRGDFDAIILAAAGLKRLGLTERIRSRLKLSESLPAIGQGAIGIECRCGDQPVQSLIEPLQDLDTADCIAAERALNQRLQGGCQVPIAGHAQLQGDQLFIQGLVGSSDGKRILRASRRGPRSQAVALGTALAEALLEQGADALLSVLQ